MLQSSSLFFPPFSRCPPPPPPTPGRDPVLFSVNPNSPFFLASPSLFFSSMFSGMLTPPPFFFEGRLLRIFDPFRPFFFSVSFSLPFPRFFPPPVVFFFKPSSLVFFSCEDWDSPFLLPPPPVVARGPVLVFRLRANFPVDFGFFNLLFFSHACVPRPRFLPRPARRFFPLNVNPSAGPPQGLFFFFALAHTPF